MAVKRLDNSPAVVRTTEAPVRTASTGIAENSALDAVSAPQEDSRRPPPRSGSPHPPAPGSPRPFPAPLLPGQRPNLAGVVDALLDREVVAGLNHLHSRDHAACVQAANLLFPASNDMAGKAAVVDAIAAVSPAHWPGVTRAACVLVPSTMHGVDRAVVVEALGRVAKQARGLEAADDEIDAFARLCGRFAPHNPGSDAHLALHIAALADAPSGLRHQMIDTVLLVSLNDAIELVCGAAGDARVRTSVMQSLPTDETQRWDFLVALKALTHQYANRQSSHQLVDLLASVPSGAWSFVTARAVQGLRPTDGIQERVRVLQRVLGNAGF